MIDTYTSLHCHSDYSTAVLRFPDALCNVKKSLDWCYENGLYGYALTDHQSCSGYVDLEKAANELQKERPFKHIFGNEFYLLSEEEDNLRFAEGQRPTYWHYLVNVLDEIGLKQMYELSARAWMRSYTYGVLRRPSFYTDFEEIVGKNPGHLVASSGCIGGYLPKMILKKDWANAEKFIKWNQQVLGKDNFYLEVQPCYADNDEQKEVNKGLWSIYQAHNIPIIVTTDVHYYRPEDREIHAAFLRSKDGGDSREPDKFYQTTHFFTPQELRDLLKIGSGFDDTQVNTMFQTTIDIADRVQPITIKKKTRVPALPITPKAEPKHYYKDSYSKYPHLAYYANSENNHEQYYFQQVEAGLKQYVDTHDIDLDKYLRQVDIEMEQVKGLGDIFGECMADYFNVVQKVIDIIWTKGDSLVGIGRGSAGCYLTNKLLGITGIDPLLPGLEDFYQWWRFCSVARSESIFDIDIDIQSFKKEQIINAFIEYFGRRRVCQCVTWGRLTSKTALERAGRGLGYSMDSIGYLKSLIPVKRGKIYSLNDCLYGNKEKGRDKVSGFEAEINKYPKLLETALAFEGMIISSGVHAGALNILKGDFTETGSFMVSSNGAVISQFDLHAAEYAGDLKFDLLSIDALQCIRSCIGLLIDSGHMKWQGTLRDTYNYYLSYDVIEKDNQDMWKLLPKMCNAFQYDSRAGKDALRKIGATSLKELTLANGLMRLAVPNGEQPMDTYVRYRSDITEWYKDMTNYGIPQDEQELLKELLSRFNGLLISQNTMMSVLMDKRVCGFTMKEADKARKAVAKKSAEALAETEEKLYTKGKQCGRSQVFLDYLWKAQIEMSKSYAFDFSHSHEYSTECLQELNMYWKFPKTYWNAAVVITQAQTEDMRENSAVAVDYGKIANSIYKAKENGINVSAPSANKSGLTFTVDEKNDAILYGLGGISGINNEIAQQIISLRPYTSFNNFYARNTFEGSLVTKSKFIQLIKGGCFDEFCHDRTKVMRRFIMLSNPDKQSLTTANLPEILSMGLPIPDTLIAPYQFKKQVCVKQNLMGNHPNFKSKKIYRIDNNSQLMFNEYCRNSMEEGTDWWDDGEYTCIVDKSIDKLFKPVYDELKEYINTSEFLKKYNRARLKQAYDEACPSKDPNKWSFQALSYYSREHELAHVNYDMYGLSKFKDIPEKPVFETKTWGKREWKQYELYRICGTVLAKNDNNHLLTLLTPENDVVSIKFNGGKYAYYKQQISDDGKVMDKSWFTRGNLLMVVGYRRGESDFVNKSYKSSIFPSSVSLIEQVNEDGTVEVRNKRYGEEEES